MKFEERLKLFCENFNLYLKSIEWLKISIRRVETIDIYGTLSLEDYEKIETLFARYCRSVDILLNKVLRSLDILELEEPLRKLDIVIRAEARGFVDNYDLLIEMKDLRNELSHEYVEEALKNRLEEVLEKSKHLLKITERIKEYIKEMGYNCQKIGV
ncbi:MAG: hypothetical protein GXN97_02525 [Aquificae bacterium]|nr:hypothetical protein [Aquificota bacterium]